MMLAIAPAEEEAGTLSLDTGSFRRFYDEALPGVYGYFLHRTGGTPSLAEDLTQETFLAAVRELKKGRRPESPIPWIFGIARHKLVDHYRRRERSDRLLARADAEMDEVAVEIRNDGGSERVVAALGAVPGAQRAVLVLHYLDGLSLREVAGLLGKTEKAVESLVGRGRASLKRAYSEGSA